MSLEPLLFSAWWEDLDRPHRLLNQYFGVPLDEDDLLDELDLLKHDLLLYRPRRNRSRRRYQPFGALSRRGRGTSTVQADKNKFQVTLDVQQFEPDEIKVKVVDKNVVVEGKHEEKEDEHGWISRQFVRKYLVPSQCDIDQVESHLSSDGVLTITAPRKEELKLDANERPIKIQFTGKPAITEHENCNDVNEVQREQPKEQQQRQQQQQQPQQQQQQQPQQQQQYQQQQYQRGRKAYK